MRHGVGIGVGAGLVTAAQRTCRGRSTATRVRILTLTPTGNDGWIGETRHLVATVILTRAGDLSTWLVDNIAVAEPLAGMPDGDVQDFG